MARHEPAPGGPAAARPAPAPRGGSLSHATVRMFARLLDAKHPATRRHSERAAAKARRLALACGWHPNRADALREAALVHDIGKLAVADALLSAPRRLSAGEYASLKEHPGLGAEIVSGVLAPEQTEWIRSHHERWDGGGYPAGLAGERIPEGARLIALAEAWDAMTSGGAYRPRMSPGEALAECEAESGRQFWPAAVRALRRVAEAPAGQR